MAVLSTALPGILFLTPYPAPLPEEKYESTKWSVRCTKYGIMLGT